MEIVLGVILETEDYIYGVGQRYMRVMEIFDVKEFSPLHTYLKTINFRQQQGRNTWKEIDFYLNGMFSSPLFGVQAFIFEYLC